MSIFDLVQSEALVAYWETLANQQPPYLGEELFPAQQKLGLDLKWIKGAKGLPVVLMPSAYDSKSKKRDRIGFDKLSAEMPFFKESTYIDEEMRQQLNMVLETGNQAYIDSVMNRVFADEAQLLEGLKACKALTAEGIKTNVTLIFTANQALLAARAGATYVSPFLGRLDDISVRGVDLIREIADIFAVAGIDTQIIAASVRNPIHVTDCALAGADIATVPYSVLEQLTKHPLTDAGIAKFQADYKAVFGE